MRVPSIDSVALPAPKVTEAHAPGEKSPLHDGFRELLSGGAEMTPLELGRKILDSNANDPRELLILQMKVSQYSQRVELCSRCAEATLATVRKFQSLQ